MRTTKKATLTKKIRIETGLKTTPINFAWAQKHMGVRTPLQLKLRIIWLHLQALVEAHYQAGTNSPMTHYKNLWNEAEKAENKKS